jgi:hypothetical protein
LRHRSPVGMRVRRPKGGRQAKWEPGPGWLFSYPEIPYGGGRVHGDEHGTFEATILYGMRPALNLGSVSMAFLAISTGTYGVPKEFRAGSNINQARSQSLIGSNKDCAASQIQPRDPACAAARHQGFKA